MSHKKPKRGALDDAQKSTRKMWCLKPFTDTILAQLANPEIPGTRQRADLNRIQGAMRTRSKH
jgi:hypothetical protein